MNEQIKPSVTNPTIADIYERINDNKLELAPDFQRKFVWTHEHQEQFIDTILKGYPFPEIYVCQSDTDLINLRTTQTVIDGQQRLTTIKNYIEGTFKKRLKIVPRFSQLNDNEKENFLQYQIVVRDIGTVENESVREIFGRINLTKFKLENVEIQNAIYDGKFIQTAKELTEEIDITPYGVFHESDFTRMADLHFFLLVMATIEVDGYFKQDSELENQIASFNEEYPNAHITKSKIIKSFLTIKNLSLEKDSIWFRKSNFFTLVVELSQTDLIPDDLQEKLIKLEHQIMKNKNKENDYGTYYSYMYAGTTSRKARVKRSELVKKYIFNTM